MDITVAYRVILFIILFSLTFEIFVNYYIYLTALFVLEITYKCVERKYREYLPVNKKAVLITGCDTGFGYYLANRLADHGFVVFAGVLKSAGSGAEKLRKRQLTNLHVVQLDITSEQEIIEAHAVVRKSSQDLWGIVNNAGFGIPGDVELCKISQYKKCHDVNLYGQISIIKTFLPMIRHSKGRIVNVSSVKGRYAWPGGSVYHTSKYGVETMSDSLRLEMVKFGVGVSLIEPGEYDGATSIKSPEMCERLRRECDEMWEDASPEVRETYGKEYFYLPYKGYLATDKTAISPNPVLEAMEDALLNVRPKPRYLVDGSCRFYDRYAMFARFYNFVPEYISDFVLSRLTGSNKPINK